MALEGGTNPNDRRGRDLTQIMDEKSCIQFAPRGLAILFQLHHGSRIIIMHAHRGLRSARMRLQYPLPSGFEKSASYHHQGKSFFYYLCIYWLYVLQTFQFRTRVSRYMYLIY